MLWLLAFDLHMNPEIPQIISYLIEKKRGNCNTCSPCTQLGHVEPAWAH